jgi:hypothetical protein
MMSVAVLGKTVETRDGTTFDRVCYANISDYEQCAGTIEDAKDILLPISISPIPALSILPQWCRTLQQHCLLPPAEHRQLR